MKQEENREGDPPVVEAAVAVHLRPVPEETASVPAAGTDSGIRSVSPATV